MNAACEPGDVPELIANPNHKPAENPGLKFQVHHASLPPQPLGVRSIAAGSRINMQIARAVSMELLRRGDSRKCKLDIELLPTQWILERWAVSIGSGLKNPDVDPARVSTVPPLDDATAIVVDNIVMGLPGTPKPDKRGQRLERAEVGSMHDLVRRWYKSPEPCSSIARNYGITTDGVYARLRRTLEVLRECFLMVGLHV